MKKITGKMHYGLSKTVGVCGYFSDNTTKDKKKVTCKFCKKELKKNRSY